MESGIDASRRGPMPARTFELTPPRYIALRGEGIEEGEDRMGRVGCYNASRPLRYAMLTFRTRAPGATPMICLR